MISTFSITDLILCLLLVVLATSLAATIGVLLILEVLKRKGGP